MTAANNVPAVTRAALYDDLDRLIAEMCKDPKFAGGYEDATVRAEIVDVLLQARRDSGLSQQAVAEYMGVKQPTISGFEAESSDPHLSTLQRYARAVGGRLVVQFVTDDGAA